MAHIVSLKLMPDWQPGGQIAAGIALIGVVQQRNQLASLRSCLRDNGKWNLPQEGLCKGIILGLYRDHGKMETTIRGICWDRK